MARVKDTKIPFEQAVSSLAFCLRRAPDEVLLDVCMRVKPTTAADLIRLLTQRDSGAWDEMDAETRAACEAEAHEQAQGVIQAYYDHQLKARGGRG